MDTRYSFLNQAAGKKKPDLLEEIEETEVIGIDDIEEEETEEQAEPQKSEYKEEAVSEDDEAEEKEEPKDSLLTDIAVKKIEIEPKKEEKKEEEKKDLHFESTDASEILGISQEEMLEEAGKIKTVFNPHPDKSLLEGKDFNHPSLDGIYGYTYPEKITEIRERKKKEREKIREEALKEQEKKEEKLKQSHERKQLNLKVPAKYPKYYEDPTDAEEDEKTGRIYYYFNFRKTLENSKFRFLIKILPVDSIDELLYNKNFMDGIAERQHEKSVQLNNKTASEQYLRDLQNMGIAVCIGILIMAAILFKTTFSIVPDNNYEDGVTAFLASDYQTAYEILAKLGNHENAAYYAKFSEGKGYYEQEDYDKAIESFSMLEPFQEDIFKPLRLDVGDEIKECKYQKAMTFYYANDYEKAQEIFGEICDYNDAMSYYYKCGYEIAIQYWENSTSLEDRMKALKYFYKVRKSQDTNASDMAQSICQQLYSEASQSYNNKEYEEAQAIFEELAKYKYDNSEAMVIQCKYRRGLDLYDSRQYEDARKILSKIPEYKDSYVLSKECIYNIAGILYDSLPTEAIMQYEKIPGYKDTNEILNSPKLLLFGKYRITEQNGSSISPVEFSFYEDGRFITNKNILSIAISTAAAPINYEWQEDRFVAQNNGSTYTIKPVYVERNIIEIECESPSGSNTYTCEQIEGYLQMITGANEDAGSAAEQTLNQMFESMIREYVEKKTDGVMDIDGKKINIFTGQGTSDI